MRYSQNPAAVESLPCMSLLLLARRMHRDISYSIVLIWTPRPSYPIGTVLCRGIVLMLSMQVCHASCATCFSMLSTLLGLGCSLLLDQACMYVVPLSKCGEHGARQCIFFFPESCWLIAE